MECFAAERFEESDNKKIRIKKMKKLELKNDDFLGYVKHLRHACRGIVVHEGKVLSLQNRKLQPCTRALSSS